MGLLQNAVFRPKREICALKKLARTAALTVLANFFFGLIFQNPILQQAHFILHMNFIPPERVVRPGWQDFIEGFGVRIQQFTVVALCLVAHTGSAGGAQRSGYRHHPGYTTCRLEVLAAQKRTEVGIKGGHIGIHDFRVSTSVYSSSFAGRTSTE